MADMPLEVIRSPRRRKTAQAVYRAGTLRVMVPAHLSDDEVSEVVQRLAARTRGKLATQDIDLRGRADELAQRFGLPSADTIEWSQRQLLRWGSCTPSNSHIRVSSRLAGMPEWVLDSVIVHELAHLEVAGHGPEFTALTARYHLTERAIGYLMAISEHSSPVSNQPERPIAG
jgi:predicted metal-dependent hydrolase